MIFKIMTAKCNENIHDAETELAELKNQHESSEEFKRHMEKVRAVLRAAELDVEKGEISKAFIDTFIDKIFVTPLEDKMLELKIKIFTGETTERYLKNQRSCMYHYYPPSDRNSENAEKSRVSGTKSPADHTIKKTCPPDGFSCCG